jgi:uncharacterized protein (TIGR02246 family)
VSRVGQSPEAIATGYIREWENAWNAGGSAMAELYTADSVLVGAVIGIGRPEIARLLAALFQQGWTRISITLVNARRLGDLVLVASEFAANGSGPNAGKTLTGKSTHVLTKVGDEWLSALHTAA